MPANKPKSARSAGYPGSISLLISACFFLSGLAGLVYEVVWARQLGLFLGITAYAHTAVITAYMAGLAAGSLYFGRYADRHPQPLKIYAWLEIGVGVYAAMTPWLFTALQQGYVAVAGVASIGTLNGHLTRFSIALLALLTPTFLMGGTLPLLVRGFVSELPAMGKITGRFYGINTLGAMAGTLLAGYYLLPRFGMTAAIFAGVVVNLGVAAIVLALLNRPGREAVATLHKEDRLKPGGTRLEVRLSSGLRATLLVGFGVAGFASLLGQMAWIRAFILVVGGSVYAFTITLAGFLAGIGLGSLLYMRYLAIPQGRLARSWLANRVVQAALLALLISLSLLLGLPVIGRLPQWFLDGYAAGLHQSFPLFQLFIFTLCASVIILPTLLMGILFPLVTATWTRDVERAGRGVGTAYAVNTAGTVLGALLGGLLILPWLGVHNSIMVCALLYLLVAAAYWSMSGVALQPFARYAVTGVAALLVIMAAWSLPSWNRDLMVSGVFVNSAQIIDQTPDDDVQQFVERSDLLYYREGRDGVVAVRRNGDNNALVINGKTDASSKFDLPTQIMLGQLPLSMHPRAERVLVIGLGSGITAGTLATSPFVKKLTILEISQEVVEASFYFRNENHAVLEDPRVELVTADARNFLMATDGKFDLIVSEPSNPWISGISNLFTDEFFQLVKSRLNPGGIMTQWFHTYSMSTADLKSVLHTMDKNFKHVSVWSPIFEDMVMVGSDQPHAVSLDKDEASAVRSRERLRGRISSDRDLVRSYLFGGGVLSRYAGDAPVNSDTRPVIEFSAPRNLYAHTTEQNMTDIFSYLGGDKAAVPVQGLVRQYADYVDAHFMHLKVFNAPSNRPSDVSADWFVSQLLLGSGARRTHGFVGSERVLAWKEGRSRFVVWAKQGFRNSAEMSATEEPPATGSLAAMRNLSGTASAVLQHGNITLPGGVDATWLLAKDEERPGLILNISWDCQAKPAGFTRYRLSASLAHIAQEDGRGTVADVAGRLQCY